MCFYLVKQSSLRISQTSLISVSAGAGRLDEKTTRVKKKTRREAIAPLNVPARKKRSTLTNDSPESGTAVWGDRRINLLRLWAQWWGRRKKRWKKSEAHSQQHDKPIYRPPHHQQLSMADRIALARTGTYVRTSSIFTCHSGLFGRFCKVSPPKKTNKLINDLLL